VSVVSQGSWYCPADLFLAAGARVLFLALGNTFLHLKLVSSLLPVKQY
jgi:hypothetical protein